MEATITINIGFNISNPLHDLIVKTSQELRDKYGSDWFIDESKYHLHFPMYLMELPERNQAALVEVAEKFLGYCTRVNVKSAGLFSNPSGLIMVKFLFAEEVYALHTKALELFNPLRGGVIREKYKDASFLAKLPVLNRKYLEEYGTQYAFENYAPHVTIARVKSVESLAKIVHDYNSLFLDKEAQLDKFQIHKATFSDNKIEDRTELIFDKPLL